MNRVHERRRQLDEVKIDGRNSLEMRCIHWYLVSYFAIVILAYFSREEFVDCFIAAVTFDTRRDPSSLIARAGAEQIPRLAHHFGGVHLEFPSRCWKIWEIMKIDYFHQIEFPSKYTNFREHISKKH